MNKNNIVLYTVFAAFTMLIVGVTYYYGADNKKMLNSGDIKTLQSEHITRDNCVGDTCLDVQDNFPLDGLPEDVKIALDKALDDEFHAHAFYAKVIEKFGLVRPFSMIIRSEEQHISSLKSLYDKYGYSPIKDTWTGTILVPETLKLACQSGVDAEIANAQLYRDTLLPHVTQYPDITSVFTNLMNASQEKHLRAFEKCK